MVRLDDISEEDANVGCHSRGYVMRGKQKVQILALVPTARETESIRIRGTDPPEVGFQMAVIPYRVSFWPWSARSNELCAAVEAVLVAKGAKSASDTSAYELVRVRAQDAKNP